MRMISAHFSEEEATFSDTAIRLGIDNTPDAETRARIEDAAQGLESVRDFLGFAIRVSSWFRCLLLNRAIRSKDTSAHTLGWAIDFTCPLFGTPRAVAEALITSGIPFDQIILEGVSLSAPDGAWVHISFDPKSRGEILTMLRSGGTIQYRKGLVRV